MRESLPNISTNSASFEDGYLIFDSQKSGEVFKKISKEELKDPKDEGVDSYNIEDEIVRELSQEISK